jgi:DNA-binding NarL/FixJ family response regulator
MSTIGHEKCPAPQHQVLRSIENGEILGISAAACIRVRPTILLADDHSVTTEALRALLREKFEVQRLALDGRALIAQANKFTPDLVVTDIGMLLLSGLDAAEQIKQSRPQTRFVFLTMMDNPNIAAGALRFAPRNLIA